MVSQEDVAKLAGVSSITVSRVINNKGNVKDDTRERVLSAINQLSYHPSQVARALNSSRVNTICAIWQHPTDVQIEGDIHFSKLLSGLEAACFDHNYDLLITKYRPNSNLLSVYHQRKVDGIILLMVPLSADQICEISLKNIPCCSVNLDLHDESICYFDADNEQGMYDGTMRLISKGHRRIAFLGYPVPHQNIDDRFRGFLRALNSGTIEFEDEYFFQGNISEKTGAEVLKKITTMSNPPTAIVCSTDRTAAGLIREAKAVGFSVPDKLSVLGFDGFEPGQNMIPPLSTVQQPVYQMAYDCVLELITKIEHGQFVQLCHIYPVKQIEGKTISECSG